MAVQFKFTGDDKDVQRALERMTKQYNALIATTKKGTDETKKMADAAKKAFDDTRTPQENYKKRMEELNALLKQGAIDAETFGRASKKAADEVGKTASPAMDLATAAARAASGFLSAAGALQVVNQELRTKADLEKKSADKLQDAARLKRDSLINLGTATRAERDVYSQGIKNISRMSNVPELNLEAALPSATSAERGMSPQATVAALRMAANVSPDDQETLKATATGLLNTASLTGSENMQENMGFALGIGRGTQVKSLKDINENLIPAAISVKKTGGTASEAAAAASTMTSLMFDSTGNRAKTSLEAFALQLEEMYPTKDVPQFNDKGRQTGVMRGTGLATFDERLHHVQASEAETQKFMGMAHFERGAVAPVREWLDPKSAGAKMYEARKQEISIGATAVATQENFAQEMKNDPIQQLAERKRAYEVSEERSLLANLKGAKVDEDRTGVQKALAASGQGWLSSVGSSLGFALGDLMGMDSDTMADDQMHQRQRKILGLGPGFGDQDALAAEEGAAKGKLGERDRERVEALEVARQTLATLKGIERNQRSGGGKNRDTHAE